MTVAIMQPYLFPYLGYFQLIAAADRFVIYDDVAFSRGGWINRNRLLDPDSGSPFWITVPVGPPDRIDLTEIASPGRWREKLLRRIEASYRTAPYFPTVWPMVEECLSSGETALGPYLSNTLRRTVAYLGIDTELVSSSQSHPASRDLSGADRVLAIAEAEGASTYLNAEGGTALYDAERFRSAGITLAFLHHQEIPYPQSLPGFAPRLSIIDAMMHNSPTALAQFLTHYQTS